MQPPSTDKASPEPIGPSPRAGLSARHAALRILADLREGRRTARESIDDLVMQTQIAPQEVSLTTELVMGVVRHRLTLAKLLGNYTTHGWQRVSRQLQHVLMLGAYQIIWMDTMPVFAAVNEAVDQAKAEGGVRAARFVNAVLRQLHRDIEHLRLSLDGADAQRTVPVTAEVGCQLRRDVFSDPGINPVGNLAEVTSHPTWLVGRWMSHFGRKTTEAICRYGMSRPVMHLRPNRLKTHAQSLQTRLKEEGFSAERTSIGTLVIGQHAAGLMRTKCAEEGLFQPQDATAMKAVERMSLQPGQVVIDLCAGAGTKTGQMAEIMKNEGSILAGDNQPGKLESLLANCRRLGISIARPVLAEQMEQAAGELKRLDWILIDAPCSNSGVLARRPEARYRIDRKTIETLTATQLRLLDLAARLARPETRLIYTTCSIEPEENENTAAAFAQSHPEWRLRNSELTLPSADGPPTSYHDGGYWSVWSR